MLWAFAPTAGLSFSIGVFFILPGSVLLESKLEENLRRGIFVFGEIVVLMGCDARGDAIGDTDFNVLVPAKGLIEVAAETPEETPELLNVFDNFVDKAGRGPLETNRLLRFLLLTSLA